MAFRLSSVLVALVALVMAALSAEAAEVTVCHITSDAYPKTFETLVVSADEWPSYEAAGDLYGPCRDSLGPLCEDGKKCTIKFDYEAEMCLPLPRDEADGCVETMEEE